MKNKYIYHLFLIAAFIGFSGCTDYLDRPVDDQITEEQIFTRYDRTNELVADLYAAARQANSPLVFFNHFSTMGMTDEGETANLVESLIMHKFNEGSWNADGYPSGSGRGQYWGDLYNRIRRANIILQGVEKYKTPDNILNPGDLRSRLGETYFLRAYLHYLVIRMYGEAVYMDYLPDPNGSMAFQRASFHAIVEKIVADCDIAISMLPAIQIESQFGRADQGAALGLKAVVRWMAATPMWNGGNYPGKGRLHEAEYVYKAERWDSARVAAKRVLDLKVAGAPRFSLFEKYDNTDFKDDDGKDMSNSKVYRRLWEMYHDLRDGVRQEGVFVILDDKNDAWQGDQYPKSRDGGSRNQPVQEQVDEYEFIAPDGYGYPVYHQNAKAMGYDDSNPYEGITRDPRFYRDVLYHGATFRNRQNEAYQINAADGKDKIARNNSDASTRTGYWTRKFLRESWNWNKGFRIPAPPVWSLPEIIYIYAEAVNQTSGPNDEIYTLLNKVRARSFMAPIPPAAKTDKALMNDYIQRERRVELFYQNNRVWTCRLYLESSDPSQLAKETAWQAAGTTDDARSKKYWPYPKTQRMVNGMTPIEDPAGKIEVDGKKYRMERFCVERRVFETPRHYLFPILTTEIKRNPGWVNNPGW